MNDISENDKTLFLYFATTNFFKILGIKDTENLTRMTLRQRYLQAIIKYHPDAPKRINELTTNQLMHACSLIKDIYDIFKEMVDDDVSTCKLTTENLKLFNGTRLPTIKGNKRWKVLSFETAALELKEIYLVQLRNLKNP